MLKKRELEISLRELDKLYVSPGGPLQPLFSSKLALLEVCGWTEESMDEIVARCSRRRLQEEDNKKYIEKKVIKGTHAFEYSNFRLMLERVVGLINIERIERKIDPAIFARLTAALSTLKISRNSEAHTHIKGVTHSIAAPSVTRAAFVDVYKGLKEINRVLGASKI